MEKQKQWFVVYTKTGREQKVCEVLRRKKLDAFYPVTKTMKTTRYGKEKISYKPLLERYVFIASQEDDLDIIKQAGILSFVHWLAQPVKICENDIYLLRQFTNTHDNIRIEKIKIKLQESASISTISSANNNSIIQFSFPALGYVMTAAEKKTIVKIIAAPVPHYRMNIIQQYAKTR